MKRKYIKTFIGATLMLLLGACSKDILEEEPRHIYEPGFFQTETGVRGGLTAMYAHLRDMYGDGYYLNACETGTDEYTYAQSADDNFKAADMSGQAQLNSNTSRADRVWYSTFGNINTASGIIENAAAVGIDEELIAEARFFRAFDYFLLTQTFGGVPLDLGAGELTFNTNPVRTSVRNTVSEVYTRAIFPDLITAIDELPEIPREVGTVTKTVARLYLAKAYLTYAWWLENPNDIPTYPDTPRTDPDGHDAQWYFQQAYDIAIDGIENPGPYALQETFYDVHVGGNERNSEILLYADHTEANEFYNETPLTGFGGGGAPANWGVWVMTWNYTVLTSSTSNSNPWEPLSSVRRAATQPLGRPWTRMAPTINVFENTFSDKANDSRYDGTFVTSYYGNWTKNQVQTTGPVYNANFLEIDEDDEPVLTFLDDEPVTSIDYDVIVDIDRNGDGVISSNPDDNEMDQDPTNIGAGWLPGRSDYVISPRGISRVVYPGIWKIGTYRTDNGNGLGEPNAGLTRPWNIAKFSEFYFVAAEAAVKGATGTMSARDLINVIRARAGKWRWDNGENTTRIEDNSAAMVAATPSVIDIDYILMERSREYFGEGYRWYDLVRTQKWEEFAESYEIAGSNYGDHTPQTVNRTIEPYHYLRPIPQGQIDGMEGDTEIYQNPGYE